MYVPKWLSDIEGTIITTDLVVDPKYATYQQFKNTLIWPLLTKKIANSTDLEKNETFKMDVIKARVAYPDDIYSAMKEAGVIER